MIAASPAAGAVPTFSVVIAAYVRMDLLERAMRYLDEQRYPADRYELLVVDHEGGTAAALVERVAPHVRYGVRLVLCPRSDAQTKRNYGARAAVGEYLLFSNDDIWANPDLLAEHARTHVAFAPEQVAVVGHVVQSAQMPYSPFTEFFQPYAYPPIDGSTASTAAAGGAASGAGVLTSWWYFYAPNVSMPRDAALRGGFLFREDWPELCHEDLELGYRWARSGRRIIYNPQARAEHFHPHSLHSACELQERIGRHLPMLQQLVDEPVLERFGVLSRQSSARGVLRGVVRRALFNAVTVPHVRDWLATRSRNTRLTRWLYWKVLLHYTERGYRQGLRLHGPPPDRNRRPRRRETAASGASASNSAARLTLQDS